MTPNAHTSDDGILCCDVGRERFAFRSRDVRHVERADYLRPDRGEDGRLGTLKLGGQQVPVYALDEIFGQGSGTTIRLRQGFGGQEVVPYDRGGHIAVTGDRHAMTGWLVDRIVRAAQPSPGDIVPLPPTVGPQAASWFEGVVWLEERESALLLAPHRLTSPPERRDDVAGVDVFSRPPRTSIGECEPVAVVFSTEALPASTARRYALSGRQIAAIVQPTAPIAVPGCHEHVRGVMWWRRAVVPVIDFRDEPDGSMGPTRRRLIAQCGARHQRSLVAFAIDSEVVMCRAEADHRLLAEVPCPAFASGVFDVNGEAVALLDLAALLAGQ